MLALRHENTALSHSSNQKKYFKRAFNFRIYSFKIYSKNICCCLLKMKFGEQKKILDSIDVVESVANCQKMKVRDCVWKKEKNS